jgi:hypothetical protein
MRARLGLCALLFVSTTACGGDAAMVPVEGAALLHYAYQPGDTLTYEVTLETTMTMEGDADMAMVGAALDTTMDMMATTEIHYSFAEGPEPDTVEITVSQTLLDGGATMTQMGQTQVIPFDDIAAEALGDYVLVVDPEGNLIEASFGGQQLPTELLGGLEGFAGQGLNQPQHIGPAFPDEPVGVGSTWETDHSVDSFGISIDQRGEHSIVSEEVVNGRTTLKIETTIRSSAAEVDLLEMMREIAQMGSLDPSISEGELDMTLEMFESLGIEMEMRIEESRTDMTTWFDPEAGLVVKSVMAAPMTVVMRMRNIPDAGDMDITADMTVLQSSDLAG